ncbi:MAG: hypothetical protein QNJ62_01740 [Methyloceanibacter sp.]|nr:hypothetical protein [Methyloceanibacter sp.]
MKKLALGLVGVGLLLGAGLAPTAAKAVPPVPAAKQSSIVEEARWRRVRVRRPVVRRNVRRPIRRTWRRATRPWRW